MKPYLGLVALVVAHLLLAAHCTRCFAVQSQEWEINKEDYFQKLAAALQTQTGADWRSTLHYADKIRGWDGTTLARVVRLESDVIKVKLPQAPSDPQKTAIPKEVPASFSIILADIRETLASESRLSLKGPNAAPADYDAFVGADEHYFWFCSPGTYGSAFPNDWQKLLGKIRQQFGVSDPKSGLQCSIDLQKNIFVAGEPIEATVSVRNTSGRAIPNPPALEPASLAVNALDGTPVPPAGTVWRPETRPSLQPWDQLAQTTDLKRSYGMRKPGKFRLKFSYKLGNALIESQEVSVCVVPDDFFALGLRRAGKAGTGKRGEQIMLDVMLAKGYGESSDLTNLAVSFRADPVGGGFASGLAGVPGDDASLPRKDQKVMPKTLQLGKGTSAFIYDLGLAKWRRIVGTQAQSSMLWDFAPMGEFWDIRAELLGCAGGDWFRITSRPVRVRVLRDAQKK